jgi:CRISPR-associated protein Cmr4
MKTYSLFIYTETSLHAGAGSTVSVVDLPIQRERTTNYPIVQGSGVKGALRSQVKLDNKDKVLLFGAEPGDSANAAAGNISVGDARIVLFPVRSLMGVFAYVTSTHVIARLARDVKSLKALTASIEDDKALVTTKSNVIANSTVVLEEFSFNTTSSTDVDKIAQWLASNALPQGAEYEYWRNKLQTSLVILPENAFADFVTTSTEIVTRVKIDNDKKVVQTGALWTQESLPSDTLLVSNITISDREKSITSEALAGTFNTRIQIGGDETTGDGFVALKWL